MQFYISDTIYKHVHVVCYLQSIYFSFYFTSIPVCECNLQSSPIISFASDLKWFTWTEVHVYLLLTDFDISLTNT